MKNTIIPKRFWWIAVIFILLPPLIGACYWISYGEFPIIEWGAVSTWYVGLFSIWLLYRTLMSQQQANEDNLADQILTQLRENTLYLFKIYQYNVDNISGDFLYISSTNNIEFKQFKGRNWFKLAKYELGYLNHILRLKNKPEDIEVAQTIYDQYCEYASQVESDPYFDFWETDKKKAHNKQYCEETKRYFESICVDRFIKSDWWNTPHSEEEINQEIVHVFSNKHQESILTFNILNTLLKGFKQKKEKFEELSKKDELTSFAQIIEASMSFEERTFYRELAKYSKKLKSLFEETNFLILK